MGLSRLDNFLKSAKGAIIYVDPSNIDSTDSIDNKGNSLARPFRSIQRALIEAARFSWQRGLNNDRFNKTTILLYPGDHIVDNRPGFIPTGSGTFTSRNGSTVETLAPWDLDTNLDLSTADNQLYKLNSIHGGVIVPRGTSIVGMDLRKTKIRPRYVPNPENDNIERSCVFRVTGACYLWQFTILDADPNGICYKDYTTNTFTPNFSHHKLAGFEYADGVNPVDIEDAFLTYSTTRTDLDMYYEKIARVYGPSSDREIQPDYGDGTVDIQPVVDEYRIVGSRGASVGISSIRAGDGATSTTTITVTLSSALTGINVDTPIQISGVGAPGYDGQYVVRSVSGSTELTYAVQNAPTNALPSVAGATLNISVDTVTSASPYIFNVSLRSVYGMCGLLADGDKADGFKSMVVAQYTGIGLQKDDKAFVKYNTTTGAYEDSTVVADLHTNSLAKFKPTYENFHIKAVNNSYLQLVSVFAIGYAQHFVVESGGDFSINNSNSNFGAKALQAVGFRKEAFSKDDVGYISHIITPQENELPETSVSFSSIDVGVTTSVGISSHLFIYNAKNQSVLPETIVDGYRVGAKANDQLFVQFTQSGVTTEYSSRIVMPRGSYDTTQYTSEKIAFVGRSDSGPTGINSVPVSSNTFTLTGPHPFINGESIRIVSDNGHLPDGLESNQIYYAIVSAGIGTDKIKVAKTLNEALVGTPVTINSKGGILKVVSRVSDKNPGDIGHPVQYNSTVGQWYVNVSAASTENTIYTRINQLGVSGLGAATPKTYIKRKPNSRSLIDSTYRIRYVIPKDSSTTARPPIDGYVIQESNNILGIGTAEIQKYFSTSSSTLSNSAELRNPRFIANATWSSNTASVTTELPHDLSVGAQVEIINVTSTNNPTGVANSAFNGTHTVTGISSTKTFTYSLTSNPGTFTNDTSSRTTALPYFKKKRYSGTFFIYRSEEIQPYIKNVQDGVYHLIVLNSSNSPTVTPFTDQRFSQPVQNLYPQINRDDFSSDPEAAKCFANPNIIGRVVVNEPQNSITKETAQKQLIDFGVGVGLTDIVSTSTTSHTLYTSIDHGLCGITSTAIIAGGSGYAQGTYYNSRLVSIGASTTGQHATAKVIVGASGTVTSVTIMDGGSAYGIGNTLSVTGIGTIGSGAQVQVTHINDHTNYSLNLSGVSSTAYSGYNTVYKVNSVTVGRPKEISVVSLRPVSTYSSGVGATHTSSADLQLTGKIRSVSSLVYDNTVGLATVTFSEAHPFRVGTKLSLSGATNSLYNGNFIVKQVVGLNTCVVNVGLNTNAPATTGSIVGYSGGLSATGGELGIDSENISGRLFATFAGISTTLGADISSTALDTTPLTISGPELLGLKLGDYIQIDDEILRIKQTVSGSSVYVFRGVLGTRRQDHVSGAVVRKINVHPVELRRHSIIRASAHTFEYLGFGPGNYSTSFPERQDRVISSQEQLLSQSTKLDGGISIFTGMNDRGDFYSGNKRINASTGQEEVFDSPIPTVTGEDISVNAGVNIGFDVISPLELNVNRAIRIEGGPNNNIVSEIKGPIVFGNKITSTSDKGVEVNNLLIKGLGSTPKKHTVGLGTPTEAGTPGDVVYHPTPTQGGYIGWVYTANNVWEPFGKIATNGTF